jgi:quercetin 2,3-dioxygenase
METNDFLKMKITRLKFEPAFPGLKGVNIFAHQFPIEPFLVFTEYYMDKPVFGPHAHAGVSVMTYMLPDSEGSFINRDSHGDFSIIEPGGVHITQAGSGIHHDEFPKEECVMTHGFQIWINHSNQNRFVKPKAFHALASEIPEVTTADYKVRIIHGSYAGKENSLKMVTPVVLLHVFLQPNRSITFQKQEMAFAYVLKGEGKILTEQIGPQNLITFSADQQSVLVKASEQGLEFMYATATPLHENITYGGPFVSTTPEQMQRMKKSYANGEMGVLAAYQ